MGSSVRAVLSLALIGSSPAVATMISVGPNINISKLSGNQAESTISVNPLNTLDLFASETETGMARFSTDGGLTWQNSNMSALPATIGDVQTAWDSFGNLFLTRFGTAGANQLEIIVARSTDGGATFGDVRVLSAASGNDQPSIAAANGQVWVDFTNSSNQVVAAGAQVTGLGAVGAFGPLQVAPNTGGDFGDIAIGPGGQVAVVYQNNGSGAGPDTIKFNLDADGLGAGGFGSQIIATNTNVGGFRPVPAQPNRTIDAEGNLAWDRSGGAHNGRLYLVYVDASSTSSTDTNIMLRYSDDNGNTWSAPVKVNDDNTANSQIQPAIAVDESTGDVAITWLDARNSANNNTLQVFGAVSENGGALFTPNFQISAGTNSCLVNGGFDCGDYDKMTFANGTFWRTWADDSNSTGDNPNGTAALDIYTAAVQVTNTGNVPEPSTLLLIPGGLTLLGIIRLRRGKSA